MRALLLILSGLSLAFAGPVLAQQTGTESAQSDTRIAPRSSVSYWSADKDRQARKVYEVSSSTVCDGLEYDVDFSYAGAGVITPYKKYWGWGDAPGVTSRSFATNVTVSRKSPQTDRYSYTIPQSAYADLGGLTKFSTICGGVDDPYAFTVYILGGDAHASYRAFLYFSASTYLGRRVEHGEFSQNFSEEATFNCFWCKVDSGELEDPDL